MQQFSAMFIKYTSPEFKLRRTPVPIGLFQILKKKQKEKKEDAPKERKESKFVMSRGYFQILKIFVCNSA